MICPVTVVSNTALPFVQVASTNKTSQGLLSCVHTPNQAMPKQAMPEQAMPKQAMQSHQGSLPQVVNQSSCMFQVGTAARSTVLSSTGGKSLKDNVVNVFGSRLADGLVPLSAETASGTKTVGYDNATAFSGQATCGSCSMYSWQHILTSHSCSNICQELPVKCAAWLLQQVTLTSVSTS